MPGRGTPKGAIRIDPRLWERLAVEAEAAGTSRAEVVRALIRWWLREPGAELPMRPESQDGPPAEAGGP